MSHRYKISASAQFRRINDRVLERASWALRTKVARIRTRRPVVSFSFDDFPRSAVSNGARLLEKYGFRGTFYAAGSLAGSSNDGISYYGRDDLLTLASRGHEIGCHTFNHVRVSQGSAATLDSEILDNAVFVGSILPGYVLRSFSYPFGHVSPLRKLRLQRHFMTCRGIGHGINSNVADLGLLRAVSVYGRAIDPRVVALLTEARRTCGWIIFYTHDVDAAPSPFGCTPTVWDQLVSLVADNGFDVLTVQQAAEEIQSAPR